VSLSKRIAVYVFLVAFTVWPLVQIGLVKRFDVNPWKLAGWGMYSAPQLPAWVQLFALTSDSVGTYELQTVQPGLQPAVDEFVRRRRGLGQLAKPDALARTMLEYYPAIDGVRIVVVQPFLDRHTGMIDERIATYEYRRAAGFATIAFCGRLGTSGSIQPDNPISAGHARAARRDGEGK
jgi:hypothetical protein